MKKTERAPYDTPQLTVPWVRAIREAHRAAGGCPNLTPAYNELAMLVV